MHPGEGLYIGLMSGTSLDGVDAVLADFSGERPKVAGAVYVAFPPALRSKLLALQSSGDDELHRAAMAANALVDVYAEAVDALLGEAGVDRDVVAAIGAHGQTVRHRPADGYTWQINNPARLSEATRIGVVADFRSRDIAAGGQGAPLVPAFHAALFQDAVVARAIVNIGGIANVTWLPSRDPDRDGEVRGWDTGPGNILMDAWCERHLREPFDRDGAWAATGIVDAALLETLAAEAYFALQPPKSTGRDLFNAEWLDAKLAEHASARPADVQATLLHLTAKTIVDGVASHCAQASEVLVCGGGARNSALMRTIGALLSATDDGPPGLGRRNVRATDELGVPANQVEALAFAWLARAAMRVEPGNLPAVTGARGLRVLGAYYPK